ncbi:MAG: SRPBCC domain-containing protein [Dehalococcoidia bacterium]
MVQSTAASVIEKDVRIAASRETVLAFLTDAAKIAEWLAPDVQAEAEPGGVLRCNFNGFDIARGEFLDVQPPSRVAFTWGWETLGGQSPPGSTRVDIALEPDGEGTHVRLSHRGLAEGEVASHAEGWETLLAGLEQRASGEDMLAPSLALSRGEALASRLNTLLIELRYAVEGCDGAAWLARCPAEGWTTGVTADHVLSHAEAIVSLRGIALGQASPLETVTAEGLDAQNAERSARAAGVTREDILGALRSDGAQAVSAVRAMPDAELATVRTFQRAGAAEATIEQVMQYVLATMADHVESVKAAAH